MEGQRLKSLPKLVPRNSAAKVLDSLSSSSDEFSSRLATVSPDRKCLNHLSEPYPQGCKFSMH